MRLTRRSGLRNCGIVVAALSLCIPMLLLGPSAQAAGLSSRPDRPDAAKRTYGTSPPSRADWRGLKTLVFDTGATPFRPGTANQGWWSDNEESQDDNANFLCGALLRNEFRNFFTFDLGTLNRHVVSARLRINIHYTEGDDFETWRLYDVSTPAQTLNRNAGLNEAVFLDLGTGSVYGQYVISTQSQDMQFIDVRLNGAAIRDINRARGRFFSMGGRLVSLGDRNWQWAFGMSGEESETVQLITRTTPLPKTPR